MSESATEEKERICTSGWTEYPCRNAALNYARSPVMSGVHCCIHCGWPLVRMTEITEQMATAKAWEAYKKALATLQRAGAAYDRACYTYQKAVAAYNLEKEDQGDE